MPVPVICSNPVCGQVWFSDLIHLAGHATAYLHANQIRPCPKCGGWGDVPNGFYSASSIKYFDRNDAEKVIAALYEIYQSGSLESASEKYPSFQRVIGGFGKEWRWWTAILLSVFLYHLSVRDGRELLHQHSKIQTAIQQIHEELAVSQSSHQGQAPEKTPKE